MMELTITDMDIIINLLENEKDLCYDVDSMNIYTKNYEASLDILDRPYVFEVYNTSTDEFLGVHNYNSILFDMINKNCIFDEPIINCKVCFSENSEIYKHFMKLFL